MTIEQLSTLLVQQKKQQEMAEPVRFTALPGTVEANPNLFGMDMGAMMRLPIEEVAAITAKKEEAAALVRQVMRGETPDAAKFEAAFGFPYSALAEKVAAADPVKKPIPKNLCVLCFDDAKKSQYTIARPLLKELGFNATFYITEMPESPRGPGFDNKDEYMTWDEIRALQDDGFELANHTLHHVFDSITRGDEFNRSEIHGLEADFAAHGLKAPVSFAYPGGPCNEQFRNVVRECGYKWGRGNVNDGPFAVGAMTYYNPRIDSPLSVCNFGDPDFYTEDILASRLDATPEGCIFGLTYHGVEPEKCPGPMTFEAQMRFLAARGIRCISMADMEEFVDPEKAYLYTTDKGPFAND